MALTDTQKAQTIEILGLPYVDLIASELAYLTTEQEAILVADVARYQVIRRKYGRLNGKDGVVFNYADERADIKERIIKMLNVRETVNAYAGNSGYVVVERA